MRWTFGLVAGTLAACEPEPPDFREVACGESPDVTITVSASGFDPAQVTVDFASVVRWDNADIEERTVRSGSLGADDEGLAFDSGPMAAGGAYCVEAREVGDQPYFEVGGAIGTLDVLAPPGNTDVDDTGYADPYDGGMY